MKLVQWGRKMGWYPVKISEQLEEHKNTARKEKALNKKRQEKPLGEFMKTCFFFRSFFESQMDNEEWGWLLLGNTTNKSNQHLVPSVFILRGSFSEQL